MNLTIVTVVFGNPQVLAETFSTWASAMRNCPDRTELVVVDNAPTAETESVVSTTFKEFDGLVKYIRSPENIGFAAGCNLGAEESETENIFFLNPDVFLPQDCLNQISKHLRSEFTGVTAISLTTHGRKHVGVRLNRLGWISDDFRSSGSYSLGPSGGAMLVTKHVFNHAGGFPEHYFAWGEDSALALQLKALGFRTRRLMLDLPHVGGHSVSNQEVMRLKARLLIRNRILTFRFQYSFLVKLVFFFPFSVLTLMNGILFKTQSKTSRAYAQGVFEGLSSPEIELFKQPTKRVKLRHLSVAKH